MIDFPKEFDDRHWWILVAIAGALIAVASAPVKFVPGFIIGLALLLFGVGQWIDHKVLTGVGPASQPPDILGSRVFSAWCSALAASFCLASASIACWHREQIGSSVKLTPDAPTIVPSSSLVPHRTLPLISGVPSGHWYGRMSIHDFSHRQKLSVIRYRS